MLQLYQKKTKTQHKGKKAIAAAGAQPDGRHAPVREKGLSIDESLKPRLILKYKF
jgi:hypothetical protein